MLKQMEAYIETHQMLTDGKMALLAVSGGVDSMVLLHLFGHSQMKFAVAHCNFQLRGEEADKDQELVKAESAKYGVTFHTVRFETQKVADQKRISIQMAARELRYDWFQSLLSKYGYASVFTAHHLDDSLETTIFNLSKGTGISGLRGILSKTDQVSRPMLFATKEMVVSYAEKHQLTWREDQSNASVKYHRNFVRKKLVPSFLEINPSFADQFHETMDRLRWAEIAFKQLIEDLKKSHMEVKNGVARIDLSFAQEEKAYPLLFELIRSFDFSLRQAKDILKGGSSGASYHSSTHWLVRDRGGLIITENQRDESFSAELGPKTTYLQIGKSTLRARITEVPDEIDRSREVALIDADKLSFPLQVRDWVEGERFRPLGMNGQKKISDFMVDRKIPLNLKKSYKVVCSEDKVVWLVGLQLDDRFKITDQTSKVYEIELIEEHV